MEILFKTQRSFRVQLLLMDYIVSFFVSECLLDSVGNGICVWNSVCLHTELLLGRFPFFTIILACRNTLAGGMQALVHAGIVCINKTKTWRLHAITVCS